MALTVFAVFFLTSSDMLGLGFFRSSSSSRTALETTLDVCNGRLHLSLKVLSCDGIGAQSLHLSVKLRSSDGVGANHLSSSGLG